MNTLAIKLILMPSVVALVTWVGRKWGNSLAGVIGSLPWVAGPIILFIAIERGIPFATNTVPGIMVGIMGWLVFCIVYIIIGQRYNPFISVVAGYLAYLLLGIVLNPYIKYLNIYLWMLISLGTLVLGFIYFPKVKNSGIFSAQILKYEIPLRMIMITLFVLAITYFADLLGPEWSGILTPFPIMTAVLAIFTHYTQGIFQVRKIFMGLFTGMLGFTLFLFIQAIWMPKYGLFYSFVFGIILDIVVTLFMKWVFTKKELI